MNPTGDEPEVRRREIIGGSPPVQPVQVEDLHAPPHAPPEDEGAEGRDRRTAQAPTEGASGLPAFDREVNVFSRDVLTPYLNFHRPRLFATEVAGPKGKTTRRYRYQDTMTPFEKLKSLPEVEQYLKPGITIAALEQQAKAASDLDAAIALNKARAKLFDLIQRDSDPLRRRSA